MTHAPARLRLIITADDFGRSHEINQAVLQAHREGILTAASLMVAGEAAEEAVEIAKANPTLAVGLHVVAVDGRAVLPAEQIPRLVDQSGWFPNAPARLGLRYFLSRSARRQLSAEIDAQFDRFAAFGIPLSHVDGHQHMHLHPAVWPIVLERAKRERRGLGIRIVRDNWVLALRHDRSHLAVKWFWAASFPILSHLARRSFDGTSFQVADCVYGLYQSGQMTEDYVIALIEQLSNEAKTKPGGWLTEIYFHPTGGDRTDEFGPNPGDLKTLLSAKVRAAIESNQVQLGRYWTLNSIEPSWHATP